MPTKLSKDQFWKLYEGLPQELKDSIFAVETGEYIEEICTKYSTENNLSSIVDLVGQVLLGVVLPEDFQTILEKELKIKKDVAKNVAHEINRFIFYPVKESLAGLHKIETIPTNGITMPPTAPKPATRIAEEKIPEGAAKPETKKSDLYKEEIE